MDKSAIEILRSRRSLAVVAGMKKQNDHTGTDNSRMLKSPHKKHETNEGNLMHQKPSSNN